MGFMGMFGGKKSTGSEGGDWGSDQVGMMKMLAGMPHTMRKPMMKGRINQLLSLTEEKRQESIREMIGAFNSPEVKSKAQESLVATRIEIVGDLPEDKRHTIIASRAAALKVAPELDEADRRVQERVLPGVPQAARTAFEMTWDRVRKNTGS